jgi:hypothetical protein
VKQKEAKAPSEAIGENKKMKITQYQPNRQPTRVNAIETEEDRQQENQ